MVSFSGSWLLKELWNPNCLICMWILLDLLPGSRTHLLAPTPTIALTPSLLSCAPVVPTQAWGEQGRETLLVTRLQEWQPASRSWPQSHISVPALVLVPLRDRCVHLIRRYFIETARPSSPARGPGWGRQKQFRSIHGLWAQQESVDSDSNAANAISG